MGRIQWFAAGGEIARTGPFKTQVEAWKAMELAADQQSKRRVSHPEDTRVWPERKSEAKPGMKKFVIHWLSGEPTTIEGSDIADAFRRAGYGGGILRAVDYWEEVKK